MIGAIVIPARYGSTRFPGKPLAMIAGKTLIQRTCENALRAASQFPMMQVMVATDDERILKHIESLGIPCVMTPSTCPTGTDRVLACIHQLETLPEFIINLQGDTPLTPPRVLESLINAHLQDPKSQTLTPALQLSWQALDTLRHDKKTTPTSGTTVVMDKQQQALWFSKQILPCLRDEEELRNQRELSPVYLHLGVYAYTYPMLQTFVQLEQTPYEKLEGLEQLRLLEHGYRIQVVPVDLPVIPSGIDTLEDALRVAKLIERETADLGTSH